MKTRQQIIEKRGYPLNLQGDHLSLYIASFPIAIEVLSKRIGSPNKTLVEMCCGIGITLGIMSRSFREIVGVDIDPNVLLACKNNLELYGATANTTLVQGDIKDEDFLKTIKGDIVIYDIPYWYPHKNEINEDLTKRNPNLKQIVKCIQDNISEDVVIFAPPHYDYEYIANTLGECEYQQIFINGQHDRNYIFLGSLNQISGISSLYLSTSDT